MPPRKRSKGSKKGKGKKGAGKRKRSGKQAPPIITVYSNGTYTPAGGVSIPPGGNVKFDLDKFPPNTNTCYIKFAITFGYEPFHIPVGTIKVGS